MPAPSASSRVGDISEADLIAWITRSVASEAGSASTLIGIGDDAAVVRFGGDAVATTDTLVHGPDFRLAWSTGYDIGWKAVAVNVADVAAMGAVPTSLLVALTLPPATTLEFVGELYRGMNAARGAFAPGADIVGGDVTVSDTLTIAITALGDLEGRAPVLRSGARPGHVIALAGEQGLSGRGLALLFSRFRDAEGVPLPVDLAVLDDAERLWLARQLRPEPPVEAGKRAALAGATAMMDVSDGLVIDARRMARASGVQLDLHADALGDDPRAALVGGEDHALLAVFPSASALPDGFRVIGAVRAGEGVSVDGAAFDERGGWDPYQDWDDTHG